MADMTAQAVQSCHDLLSWPIPQLDKFPRRRWFSLGERLEVAVLEVLGKQGSGLAMKHLRLNGCAGARGGTRADKPKWVRILAITAGSSMAAMIFKEPPHWGHFPSWRRLVVLHLLLCPTRVTRVIRRNHGWVPPNGIGDVLAMIHTAVVVSTAQAVIGFDAADWRITLRASALQ